MSGARQVGDINPLMTEIFVKPELDFIKEELPEEVPLEKQELVCLLCSVNDVYSSEEALMFFKEFLGQEFQVKIKIAV